MSMSGARYIFVIFYLFGLLIFIGGLIILQVFLSRLENKWSGLILPSISLLFSLIPVLSIAVFDRGLNIIITSVLVFLLFNIPTAIFFTIYFYYRNKKKKNQEISKMSIQDL